MHKTRKQLEDSWFVGSKSLEKNEALHLRIVWYFSPAVQTQYALW